MLGSWNDYSALAYSAESWPPSHVSVFSYLSHVLELIFVIQRILPDYRAILISNLSTGMDLYPFGQSQPIRSFQQPADAAKNFPMTVAFLSDGETVMCGAPRGDVMLWDVRSGELKQSLPHNGMRTYYLQMYPNLKSHRSSSSSCLRTRYYIWIIERIWSVYFKAGRTRFGHIGYIAASTAQSGNATHIYIWKTKLSKHFQYCIGLRV